MPYENGPPNKRTPAGRLIADPPAVRRGNRVQMAHVTQLSVFICVALLFATGWCRDVKLDSAAAPGMATQLKPIGSVPDADVLFSLAATSALLTPQSLTLTDVASSAQFSTARHHAGLYTTAEFTNSTLGSHFTSKSGEWMDDPVSVLYGSVNGTVSAALLQLAKPMYNATAKTIVFQSTVLNGNTTTHLTAADGVAARLIDDAANGVGASLQAPTAVPADGLAFGDVALFIDQNSLRLGPDATTKDDSAGWLLAGGVIGVGAVCLLTFGLC
ncbi:hypothetical protein WJX81_000310 [Elliptochloris bilobata]|uniref:Uncharacterized protein n=1 Tax=Elliptochloris bilobata TaxID=381761 RepID=A0AAW1SE83_9CHLO